MGRKAKTEGEPGKGSKCCLQSYGQMEKMAYCVMYVRAGTIQDVKVYVAHFKVFVAAC